MKITTKKEMTLPELMTWVWDNRIKDRDFKCTTEIGLRHNVRVNCKGGIDLDSQYFYMESDRFEVEIEEEITEETVFPILVTKNKKSGGYTEWEDDNICCFITENVSAFYIPNDDLTLTLIWKNGGMVE